MASAGPSRTGDLPLLDSRVETYTDADTFVLIIALRSSRLAVKIGPSFFILDLI